MPGKPQKSPAALAAVKIAGSGLSKADARILKFQALSSVAVVKLDPSFKPYPALRIPYFTIAGRPDGFYRLRYLGEMTGFDAMRSKVARYVQPPDSPPRVYLPPYGNWETLSKDPGRALFITEGELKAAAACKVALPTIGLGGIWSWKSTKRNIGFLPELEAFTWKGRMVYLVFDSDFATNPDVMKALVALAKELGARGAQPYLVSLPDLPKLLEAGKKTGLDDYLVSEGKEEFEKLVTEAEPFSQAEELWQLNSEVVYIKDPGLVIELSNGRKMAASAFKEHAYANRHYYETSFNAKGEQKQSKKPLAPAWLQWEERAELDRITYRPGAARVIDSMYNYWPGWGCDPKRGDVGLWRELLDYLFQAEPAARTWFERWLAYPIQNPGAKLYTAAVLWGPTQGIGKSLVGYSVGRIYGTNFTEISDDDLGGSFNEWAENKQFVMGDDVTSAEYKKALMDELKFMITRQSLRVNAKYMPTYVVPDCVNYYFTANPPDAFLVEDTDRRYFIHRVPDEPLPRDFYDRYDKALHSGTLGPALFWHLLNLDMGDFNPKAQAMETAAKRSMIRDSKSDLGQWVAELKENPENVLRLGEMQIKADIYTATQLLKLYDPEEKKKVSTVWLGREMKKAGLHQLNHGAVIATSRGPQRLWAVRNEVKWQKAKQKDCAEHWNKHFARAVDSGTKAPPGEKKDGGKY